MCFNWAQLLETRRAVIKSVASFFLTIILLISLLAIPKVSAFINGQLSDLIAFTAGAMLDALGLQASVNGSIISTGGFTAEIIAACTPLYPAMIFLAAVFAFPCPVKHKCLGIVSGLPSLAVINQVRVVSLIWIGQHYPKYLDIAHYFIWQAFIIALAIALWLYWTQKVSSYEHK